MDAQMDADIRWVGTGIDGSMDETVGWSEG